LAAKPRKNEKKKNIKKGKKRDRKREKVRLQRGHTLLKPL